MATEDNIYENEDKYVTTFHLLKVDLESSNFRKKYPVTYKFLLNLESRISELKTAIICTTEAGNQYSSKVLFRALIEHYIRFVFIFIKWADSRHDQAAKNYYVFSNVNNTSYTLNDPSQKLRNDHFSGNSRAREMNYDDQYYSNYKKTEAIKYSFKGMIHFLTEKTKEDEKPSFLHSVINEYSTLSSYVHGGTLDLAQQKNFYDKHLFEKELRRLAAMSAAMDLLTKKFFLQAIKNTDPEIYSKYKT